MNSERSLVCTSALCRTPLTLCTTCLPPCRRSLPLPPPLVCCHQVLLEVLIIGLQVLLAGIPIGSRRRKYFNKEFFEKHFPELKGNVPQGQGRMDAGTDARTEEGGGSEQCTAVVWVWC